MGCVLLALAALFALAMLVLTAIGINGQIVDAQCENGNCPSEVEGTLYQLFGFVSPVLFVLTVIVTAAWVVRSRSR